jgi:nucleotide-binding universal stress UspA family protein
MDAANRIDRGIMATLTRPQTVVVGVDYSVSCELALVQSLELASSAPRAELHVIHVTSTFPALVGVEPAAEAALPVSGTPGEAQKELERHVERCISEFVSRRERSAPLPSRVVCHVRFSSPAEEIAELARELEAHLVVVGTHSRRGLSRMLLGSVAEGVVRLAPCPVLVVRPRETPDVPSIDPPCPRCVRTRLATGGKRQWCNQHSERHGPRHTYHQGDRIGADGAMPLVFRG